ncbi:MAG: hypothetical protein AAFY28_00300, partial [Actinomycetota bacterium]
MSVDLAVLIASTALGVLAVYFVVTPPAATRARPSINIRPAPAISGSVAGVVVLAASGWLLPSLVVGGGVWWLIARASAPTPASTA